MAVTGPLVQRRKVIRVGQESTRGTGVTPATEVLAFDPVINAVDTTIERKPVGASGGHAASQVGMRIGTLSFRAELRGNGSAGSADLDDGLELLLYGCGFQKDTGVYKPQSVAASQNSLSLWVWQDGLLKKLTGCSGNVRFVGEPGGLVYCEFDFSGVWVAPTDVALVATTHSSVVAPRFASATLTLGSWAPRLATLALDMGNVVAGREDVTTAAGMLHYCVTERSPMLTGDAEAELVANHDLFGLYLAGTTAALSWVIGSAAGNIITIAAPAVQHRAPAEGERDGRLTHDFNAQCNTNSDAGDDDVTITPS